MYCVIFLFFVEEEIEIQENKEVYLGLYYQRVFIILVCLRQGGLILDFFIRGLLFFLKYIFKEGMQDFIGYKVDFFF